MISLLILPLIVEIVYSTLKSFLLNDTPIWSFEVTIFLYGTFFMLGAAYCHMKKAHVAVEALAPYLSVKWRRRFAVFSEAVVLFVVLTLLVVSIPTAWRSTMMLERSTHQTPFNPQVWWYRWIIPISCLLLSYQSIRDMVGIITGRGTDKEREDALEEERSDVK